METVEKNWKEFFMAMAVAVVFIFQSIQGVAVHENKSFIEQMDENREEIRAKLTARVNEILEKKCSEHLIEYHMESIDDEAI